MVSAAMDAPGLLQITVFWNEGYDVITSVDDVTNKILSRDSDHFVMCSCEKNLVTVVFLWEKLSQLQLYKDLTGKTTFFREVVLVQVQ